MRRPPLREFTLPFIFAIIGTLALILLTSGCTQLGLVQPQTPEEKIAAGFATAEAMNNAAVALLESGKISMEDARNVLEITVAAARGLVVARGLIGRDPAAAETKIAAVRATLETHRAYLKQKGGDL